MQHQRFRQFAPLLIAIYTAGLSLPVLSEDTAQNQTPVQGQQTSAEQSKQAQDSAKQLEIEGQIKRIEEKLETEPKVEGWVLVGDAYMHLERYSDAVNAYQNAYLLSEESKDVKSKLKRALYYAGLERQ
jgi:cytochrome c-type biogenesis protein CcmH/NrfG